MTIETSFKVYVAGEVDNRAAGKEPSTVEIPFGIFSSENVSDELINLIVCLAFAFFRYLICTVFTLSKDMFFGNFCVKCDTKKLKANLFQKKLKVRLFAKNKRQ